MTETCCRRGIAALLLVFAVIGPATAAAQNTAGLTGVARDATGAVLPWQWRTPEPEHVWLFLLVGVTGTLGQFFMNQAFRFGEASMLAPLDYTALIWAAALGYVFWSEVPSPAVLAGVALVVVSTMLVRGRGAG